MHWFSKLAVVWTACAAPGRGPIEASGHPTPCLSAGESCVFHWPFIHALLCLQVPHLPWDMMAVWQPEKAELPRWINGQPVRCLCQAISRSTSHRSEVIDDRSVCENTILPTRLPNHPSVYMYGLSNLDRLHGIGSTTAMGQHTEGDNGSKARRNG